MSDNMAYLIAAYTSVWVVLGFYIFILIRRNRKLQAQCEALEMRIVRLEEEHGAPHRNNH